MPRVETPQPARLAVARALLGWARCGFWFLAWIVLDTLRGRRSEERTARHAHRILSRMHPVARKVAQLFAFRFDLLSIPMAMTLARLDDVIPPLSTEEAVGALERALGKPLSAVFSAFDPEPLGSRVLRCTYQAVLLDGSEVIVRIRPPRMRQRLLDHLTALEWLLAILELLTVVRPGFFRYLKAENQSLLMEEADYRHQARSQRLFELRTRRDDIDFATVAPHYEEWVRDDLTIVRKVDGPWLSEVVAAVEDAADHPERLSRLHAQGIDPEKLARRLMQLAWWEQIEHLFFQAAPIPADVVVEPGGRLAMVHFTTTSSTTSRHRSLLRDLYERVAAEDASGATEVLIQFLTPIPFIDTHAFFKRVEARVWHQILAMHDREALWWERATVGLWAALLAAAREEGIQVHLEVIHLMRSSMMFEAMAFRLNPEFDLVKEFRRYRRRADVRRRLRRTLRRALGSDPRAVLVARISEAASLAQRVGFFMETQLENLPITNLAMPQRAAYGVSVVLQTVTLALLAAVVGVGVQLAASVARGEPVDVSLAAWHVLHHPVYVGVVAVLGFIGVRRLLFRLGDKDQA